MRVDKNGTLEGFLEKSVQDIRKKITLNLLLAYVELDLLFAKLVEYLDLDKKIYLIAGI